MTPARHRPTRLVQGSVALLAMGATLTGCGGHSVTAASYATHICTALSTWDNAVITRTQDLAGGQSGQLTTSDGKALAVSYLGALLTDTQKAAAAIQAAGTPSVSGGSTIAATLTSAFQQAVSTFRTVHNQIAAISPSDHSALHAAAKSLGSSTDGSLNAVGRSVHKVRTSALSATLTKEPACAGLSSTTGSSLTP